VKWVTFCVTKQNEEIMQCVLMRLRGQGLLKLS